MFNLPLEVLVGADVFSPTFARTDISKITRNDFDLEFKCALGVFYTAPTLKSARRNS